MKNYQKLILLLFAAFIFVACDDRKDAIDDLRTLVEDIRQNGNEYTAEQWADAEAIYADVSEDLDAYEYTREEKKEISDLKAEYLTYIAKWKAGEKFDMIRDIANQVTTVGKSIMDGLSGKSDEDEE